MFIFIWYRFCLFITTPCCYYSYLRACVDIYLVLYCIRHFAKASLKCNQKHVIDWRTNGLVVLYSAHIRLICFRSLLNTANTFIFRQFVFGTEWNWNKAYKPNNKKKMDKTNIKPRRVNINWARVHFYAYLTMANKLFGKRNQFETLLKRGWEWSHCSKCCHWTTPIAWVNSTILQRSCTTYRAFTIEKEFLCEKWCQQFFLAFSKRLLTCTK